MLISGVIQEVTRTSFDTMCVTHITLSLHNSTMVAVVVANNNFKRCSHTFLPIFLSSPPFCSSGFDVLVCKIYYGHTNS